MTPAGPTPWFARLCVVVAIVFVLSGHLPSALLFAGGAAFLFWWSNYLERSEYRHRD